MKYYILLVIFESYKIVYIDLGLQLHMQWLIKIFKRLYKYI